SGAAAPDFPEPVVDLAGCFGSRGRLRRGYDPLPQRVGRRCRTAVGAIHSLLLQKPASQWHCRHLHGAVPFSIIPPYSGFKVGYGAGYPQQGGPSCDGSQDVYQPHGCRSYPRSRAGTATAGTCGCRSPATGSTATCGLLGSSTTNATASLTPWGWA